MSSRAPSSTAALHSTRTAWAAAWGMQALTRADQGPTWTLVAVLAVWRSTMAQGAPSVTGSTAATTYARHEELGLSGPIPSAVAASFHEVSQAVHRKTRVTVRGSRLAENREGNQDKYATSRMCTMTRFLLRCVTKDVEVTASSVMARAASRSE